MENDEWKEYSFETFDELEKWMEENLQDSIWKYPLNKIQKLNTTDSTVNSA